MKLLPRLPILLLATALTALVAVANAYAITGAQGGVNLATGQRPLRQEISVFQNAGPAFDLYILAFQQFALEDQTSLLSYYQVAGIHGHPYVSWDGVSGQYPQGYCPHQSILFPTWHRAYLALFEQILWNYAQQIASTYPAAQRANYQAAAQTFRMPYWDWAANITMPDIVNKPVIYVNSPSGFQSVINPLYNYTFHPQPSAADFPPNDAISKYHSTVRYPDAAGQSQPELVNAQLQSVAIQFRSMTYQLITQEPSYAPFSNIAYSDGRGGQYNSIENMHNGIHLMVGHGGHMAIIPYSSFDPIFWLHHTNVDRLFAIWQAIYPNASYVTSQADAPGTFTNAPGSIEDFTTPLTPFHSDASGTVFNSRAVRSTRLFGYTYPGVIDWGVDAVQLAANVRTAVNQLYNPTGRISSRASKAFSISVNAMSHEYFINVKINSSEVLKPLFVHFYVGSIPPSPGDWTTAKTLVGTYAAMAHSKGTMVGQIALTHALADAPIPDLSPQHVVPYLSTQLGYNIQRLNDSVVDAEEVPSLMVAVVGQKVEHTKLSDAFPKYGPLVEYWQATHKLVGGLKKGGRM